MPTPVLGLPTLFTSQAQKEVTVNLQMQMLELLVFPIVESIQNNPGGLTANKMYIVGTSPTSTFTGNVNKLALNIEGSWKFITPRTHMRVYLASDSGNAWKWNGSAWVVGP